MKCRDCRSQIRKWRTERLSGNTCDCGANHSIDQYPHDLQTKELRRKIARIMNTSRFREIDWIMEENKLEKEK